MSCFPLVVQDLNNDINKIIDNDEFDTVLGDGAGEEVAEMLACRFNMDGQAVSGRKVSLLDPFHIWTFLCDSFIFEWCNHYVIRCEDGFMYYSKQIISHFVPSIEEDYLENRESLVEEFEVSCIIYIPS